MDQPTFYSLILAAFVGAACVFVLSKRRKDQDSDAPSNDALTEISALVKHMGYDLTPFGAAVALASVENGYSRAETASHLTVVSFARDAKEADAETVLTKLPFVGAAILRILEKLHDEGNFRRELWENDAGAIAKMMLNEPGRDELIELVLSDEMALKGAFATSRLFPKSAPL